MMLSKIQVATRYLKDTAALWRRRRYEDIKGATATIDTWAEFVADYNKQFYPENAKNDAKSRLRKLKQYCTTKRLGINATKGSGTIKVVNSPAKAIHGVAKDVRAFPMPFANSLCILDGGKTFTVSTERDAKSGAKTLSAMQFKKGFNKSEPCYLVVTRLETDKGSNKVEVPKVIERTRRSVTYRQDESLVLGQQDQGRRINDGRCKDKAYPRLGTTNQGYGVEIFSWFGELLPKVHHGILGHSILFDGPIEEEQSLDMGRRVPSDVREFEEGGYGGTDVETTGCDHAFRVTHGCIGLCYWRSSNARRTPDRIRESEVK
ncbi:gag-aspartyl protease domain-containing protein [Tanacetum coccineum]